MSGASGLENNASWTERTSPTPTTAALAPTDRVKPLGGARHDFRIKEVQVKTGGYGAEFGQATGGVVNVITKSGSNQLRGSAFAYAQPKGLEGGWKQFQATNGSVNTQYTKTSDVGVEVGGRVIRDRVFFFGAIDPGWQTRTFTAPPNFPLASSARSRATGRRPYAAKAVQLNSAAIVHAATLSACAPIGAKAKLVVIVSAASSCGAFCQTTAATSSPSSTTA
jgi:hypothetical protein